MSKKRRGKPKKGCAAVFSLPFLAISIDLPGPPAETGYENAQELKLINIAERNIAPTIIPVIEAADKAKEENKVDAVIISGIQTAAQELDHLEISEEDRSVLLDRLSSYGVPIRVITSDK